MMGKQAVFLFLIVCSIFGSMQVGAQSSSDTEGETRYISDDLFTYIHAGPGRNFRILGSVTAGTRVTLLSEDTESNFSQIVDDKKRSGWVDSDFINKDRSVRELVPGLQQQAEQSENALKEEQTNNESLHRQIDTLTTELKQVKQQLAKTKKANEEINETLESYDQSANMEWFTRGGIVAVISLLLGIILTYLPKKRRRNDNWM